MRLAASGALRCGHHPRPMPIRRIRRAALRPHVPADAARRIVRTARRLLPAADADPPHRAAPRGGHRAEAMPIRRIGRGVSPRVVGFERGS
jgi:hypothetical protein